MYILCKMYKAGTAVFKYIIDKFLYNPEDDEFFFGFQPVLIIMKSTAGVNSATTADFLEQVIDGRLQPEIFQRGRHKAMAYVTDKLDSIINNLPGLEDALKLGYFILVYKVFIQVKAGSGQQGAGIIVEVGGKPLAFFFLQLDAGAEHHFLLVDFHLLQLLLEAEDFTLVKNDKKYKPNSKYKHAKCTHKEYN